MWEEIELPASKLKYVLVHRQNLSTLEISRGTIHCREDLAKEIVERSNREDMDFNMWWEED